MVGRGSRQIRRASSLGRGWAHAEEAQVDVVRRHRAVHLPHGVEVAGAAAGSRSWRRRRAARKPPPAGCALMPFRPGPPPRQPASSASPQPSPRGSSVLTLVTGPEGPEPWAKPPTGPPGRAGPLRAHACSAMNFIWNATTGAGRHIHPRALEPSPDHSTGSAMRRTLATRAPDGHYPRPVRAKLHKPTRDSPGTPTCDGPGNNVLAGPVPRACQSVPVPRLR